MCSTHIFIAINSMENELDSTVFCRLLNHIIGARFRNITKPVCERRVTIFEACDASTNAIVVMDLPRGSGIKCLGGISSTASRYCPLNVSALSPEYHEGSTFGDAGSKYRVNLGLCCKNPNIR